MNAPAIVVLGRRLPPLARIAEVGEVLGYGSRSAAYRAATCWPLTGPLTSRRVVVPRLLSDLGIPFAVEAVEASGDD